ncbi:MAG: tRNA uridine-5-carboxymethylaminomethyl(34) synthesis GTPase MnmE [Pseudomonadota bacterium]
MSSTTDTIAAVATAPGRAGIGVVRISGPEVPNIARQLLGCLPKPRRAMLAHFHDAAGAVIDQGIALYFPGPASYTGEDVLELQGHGGPVVIASICQAAKAAGARDARPGEFSERAFLNDKIDLTQAEAVSDLIDSGSEAAARAAMQSLRGEFSKAVDQLLQALVLLRTHVEAAIDFPEEEIDFLDDAALNERIEQVAQQFDTLMSRVEVGKRLAEGVTVVLVGEPNVGKSSLLNALLEEETAIVTDVPGTTRDLVRADTVIRGVPVHLTDTAGLRDTTDIVEQEGIRRSRKAIEDAQHVLIVVDARTAQADEAIASVLKTLQPHQSATAVFNKRDLVDRGEANAESCLDIDGRSITKLLVSAKERRGIGELRALIGGALMGQNTGETPFTARQRHIASLTEARARFDAGVDALRATRAGELLAEELRLAQQSLDAITGRFTSDDLLGEIFSSFCIGK